MPSNILLLPGWQNSGPTHWQSRWEHDYGYVRVEQHDWQQPLRGDWIIQLEEAVLKSIDPVYLVAHSLGCIQVAAWAAHSQNTHRVIGALLVAPPDIERGEIAPLFPSWSPIVRTALPFSALVVASSNDPFCSIARAEKLASDWHADFKNIGPHGHLNADSNLGAWPQGHALLQQLKREPQTI